MVRVEPFTYAEIQAQLLIRKALPIPKELLKTDVTILHCPFDLIYLDRLDKPSIFYNHRAERPHTFMLREILKRTDPLRAMCVRKDLPKVLAAFRTLYQKADVVVSNSRFVQEMTRRYFRVESFVVYPPVDLKRFRLPNPHKPKRSFFLSVQRINWQKRVELQIEAFNGLREKLVIVGGPLSGSGKDEQLEYLCHDIPNISYLGRVSDKRLVWLMQNAKAVIQTGWFEDFGLVPIEAMACGTPVICVDEGGFRETVHSPELGKRIKKPYIKSLREVVKSFDSSAYDTQTLRLEAEKYGEKRFAEQMREMCILAVERHGNKH
jgi:glycosyltransferase involved in cell wall biosynthesis